MLAPEQQREGVITWQPFTSFSNVPHVAVQDGVPDVKDKGSCARQVQLEKHFANHAMDQLYVLSAEVGE